jgi:hypothetical protein
MLMLIKMIIIPQTTIPNAINQTITKTKTKTKLHTMDYIMNGM